MEPFAKLTLLTVTEIAGVVVVLGVTVVLEVTVAVSEIKGMASFNADFGELGRHPVKKAKSITNKLD